MRVFKRSTGTYEVYDNKGTMWLADNVASGTPHIINCKGHRVSNDGRLGKKIIEAVFKHEAKKGGCDFQKGGV